MDGIELRQLTRQAPYEGRSPQRQPSAHLSGRSLDFCLLAVCSCLLSVMCHQAGGVASQTARAATASPPQIDFVVKAGLATAPRQDTESSDEEDV